MINISEINDNSVAILLTYGTARVLLQRGGAKGFHNDEKRDVMSNLSRT